MYKQTPNMPALFGAVICLISGGLAIAGIKVQHEYVPDSSMVGVTVLITVVLTMICLLIAFARYRFPHLRNDPKKSHSKKSRRDSREHHHR